MASCKWHKASACLNRLTDELSELTIEQGFQQGFIDYYGEFMELRRTLPVQSDDPLDEVILRRKVTGVRSTPGTKRSQKADSELMLNLRRKNAVSMQSMKNKCDALESRVRKMSADPRMNKDMVDCHVCGEKGHFGRDCSRWSSRSFEVSEVIKQEGDTIVLAMGPAKQKAAEASKWGLGCVSRDSAAPPATI